MTRSKDPYFGAGAASTRRDPPEEDLMPGGSFEVAGWGGRALAELGMKQHPEVRTNFRSTLRDMVGPEFSAQEFDVLEDRALDAVTPLDLGALTGIHVGSPVDVTKAQKRVIDRLMRGLGDDALGQTGREAYGEALRNGKIRVR